MNSIADKTPECYHFVYAFCSNNPILTFESQDIRSKEGFQQDNPLSSLGFCETIHPTLNSLNSDLRIDFMDYFSLLAEVSVLANSVQTLIHSEEQTGLFFNASNCEIIENNLTS